MRRLFHAFLLVLAIAVSASAQAPPGTGGYTFQGQGNIAQVFSGLINPQFGQVPFGTKLGGYSLLVPFGDVIPGVSLGQLNVQGAHWKTQTCTTSPCAVTATQVTCNAASGPITLQLPGANGTGFFTAVQKVDNTSNACNITTAGSDSINGLNVIPITTPFLPMLLDDAQTGAWFAGLLTLATGATGINGFPLLGTADFNNYSGVNVGGMQFVQQPAPSNLQATATCTGTCATTYTYEVSCLTTFGESVQLSNGTINTTTATNAASLSTANNNALSWTFQPQCRSGYNIYGRIGGSVGLLITQPPNVTTWTDDGSIVNPANSYTLSWSASAYAAVQVWDLQGALTSNPIDVSASASGTSTRPSAPAITTTLNHDLQVATYFFDRNAGTYTAPTGFTAASNIAASPITNYGLGMSQKDRSTAGAIASSLATTAVSQSWATLNMAIKSSNVSNAITIGTQDTHITTSPYTSMTFGDPSGTSTGDLELICISYLQGTTLTLPTAPAAFQLIKVVTSGTNKVQGACYYNAPNVSALPPPPTQNTTGGIQQVTPTGQTVNILPLEGYLVSGSGIYGNNTSGNFPTGSILMQATAQKPGHFVTLTSTNLSLNGGSCSTAPTFNVFDGSTNGTAKIASASAQAQGTATTQAETLPFLAGDTIGLFVSTQGATCLAPTFAVSATLNYP